MTAPPWRFRAALRRPARPAIALQLALLLGCRVGTFACEGADACIDGGEVGMCQPDGWCSFADLGCASGQRYGAHAPASVANTCVALDEGTQTDAGHSASGGLGSSATTEDRDVASDVDTTASSSGGDGICGDGVIDPGEACDPGFDGFGACTPACQPDVCGDGWVGPDEACDGGATCDAQCRLRCGNGVVDAGEPCDASASDPGPLDCHALGFESGVAVCRGCELDTGACVPCSSLGCSCVEGERCERGRTCVVSPFGDLGRCLRDCETDDTCDEGTACIEQHCAIQCTPLGDVCPPGTSCSQLLPSSICL